MKEFFRVSYQWQSVYYHFQKWSKDGSWEFMWQQLLDKHKASFVDVSKSGKIVNAYNALLLAEKTAKK